MRLAESLRVASTAISANKLRSSLTVLGVVIGVMSVVLLVAVGTGARDEVTEGVESLGSNLLIVVPGEIDPGQAPARSAFTLDDVDRLRRDLPPGSSVTTNVAGGETVRAGALDASATVLGVTPEYPQVTGTDVARGEFLTESDVLTGRRVVVLSAAAGEELFDGRDPIAQQVTIGGLGFRVIGVTAGTDAGPAFGPQAATQVFVPVTAAQQLFNLQHLDTLLVQAPSQDQLDRTATEVERVLATAPGPERGISVITQEEILGVAGELLDTLTFVLAAIAGISLLVGGIGVSNIMLVSVSERTREVGLRKALGARTRDITAQFLAEAVVLCGLGGVLGIGLGVGLALLAEAATPVPATITAWSVLTAFGVSVGVGVVFGTVPARRAGKMDPVVALRRE